MTLEKVDRERLRERKDLKGDIKRVRLLFNNHFMLLVI